MSTRPFSPSVLFPVLLRSCVLLAVPLHATVIGMNVPVKPLDEARIMTLPVKERGPWLDYLKRSAAQMAADKAALAKEREGMTDIPGLPKQGNSGRSMRLHAGDAWYKTDEARKAGDIVISFQTPAGGWSKNLAMDEPRAKGQIYATGNLAPTKSEPGDFDEPKDPHWHYIGTLDNDATNTELHFLAELSNAFPGKDGDKYRASAIRGYEYLLKAQYPNGGWPQVYPLEGGYHDAITFNDNAVTESAETLTKVANGVKVTTTPDPEEVAGAQMMAQRMGRTIDPPKPSTEDYTFVPAALRARARAAAAKALQCILAAQIRIPMPDGKGSVLTVWAQQNDPLTLEPVSARNYEMPALASGESADTMDYLMSLPHPSPAVIKSVDAAAAWFESSKIMGYAWVGGRGPRGGGDAAAPGPNTGRVWKQQEGAGPAWARYYSLTTGKPIFGDRDKTIHDDVMELSLERRNGYAWYGSGEEKVLKEYATWSKEHHAS